MTTTKDPYDELAAMYLTEEPTAEEPPRQAPAAEFLIVGHLPVRASLWLGPYMDAVAREHGPAALIRLDGEEPALHLVADDEHNATFAKARSLRELVLDLRHVVRRWVVRPPIGATPETLLQAGPDRLTLLTSVDQAALVHGYRVVKELVLAADHLGRPRPRVGAAVLGVDRDRADIALARLSATTGAYLDMDIPLVCALPRIDTGPQTRGMRSFPGQPCPPLDEILGWLRSATPRVETPAPSVTPPPIPTPTPPPIPVLPAVAAAPPVAPVPLAPAPAFPVSTDRPTPLVLDISGAESPEVADHVPPPLPSASPPLPAVPRTQAYAGGAQAKLYPKGFAEVEPKHPPAAREPDAAGRPVALSSYVPGLRGLPARCPDHETVELAVDDRGRLHLLAPETAQQSVPVVEHWAIAHRELIGLACPTEAIDPRRRPITHLFFADPLRAAALHGSAFALHLLTTVEVDGRSGWYVATLAAPRGTLPAGGARVAAVR